MNYEKASICRKYKCYIMIQLTVLEQFIFIRQANQKIAIFITIINKGFKFQKYVCNRWHTLLMMSMNFCYIAILKVKHVGYH